MLYQLPTLTNTINGKNINPRKVTDVWIRSSNTTLPLQQHCYSDSSQIDDAISIADSVYKSAIWENTDIYARAHALEAIANELSRESYQHAIAQADSVTTGVVISTTRQLARMAPLVFRNAAHIIRSGFLKTLLTGPINTVEYLRKPRGPALLINPWNGPTVIGAHKVASALAAGAPCILKPSEWAPHSSILIARAISKAGLPKGVFQLLCGNANVGRLLVNDTRMTSVSFTGGLNAGRSIASTCAPDFRPVQLELGGNNPVIVFEDADLCVASRAIVFGMTNLNAQWCRAPGQLLIHKNIKDKLLNKITEALSHVKLGSSMDENSTMGPMAHSEQYRRVLQQIDELKLKGGKVIMSTPYPLLPGYFVPPTLVCHCSQEDSLNEIFGPVVTVHEFSSENQALSMTRKSPYGLEAYIFGKNHERNYEFARQVKSGGVKINGIGLLSLNSDAPRSVWGLSGVGEEGDRQTIDFFTGAQVIGESPLPLNH